MVEATTKRMLLEPVQPTQSPDVIVFQNGVLNLKHIDAATAFTPDKNAPIKYSHGVWSYFDVEVWSGLAQQGSHLVAEKEEGEHFSKLRKYCRAVVPVFSGYMDQWFPGDKAAYEVVLRWFGYSMTTDTRESKFMFFYGPTRAGKGSVARLLCGIVGKNNYSAANYSAFEDKFQASGMHDKLVVTMEECEATPKEHEKRLGMLKKYLGGERIVWEQKYMRPFEDVFLGKLIMQSNEVLAYEDKGRSVTARMIPMEFKQSFDGIGAEAPDRVIFNQGEQNKIATIAAMMWYRMRRNAVRGAFEFGGKDSGSWVIGTCKACQRGKTSLLLESHKILWPFLVFFEGDYDEKMDRMNSGRWIKCTRNNLREMTEKVLSIIGKNSLGGNIGKVFREAIQRDFPNAKEIHCKIGDLGRERGWKNLFIDIAAVRKEYPELLDNVEHYESLSLRLLK
jgi:hypothetical protein